METSYETVAFSCPVEMDRLGPRALAPFTQTTCALEFEQPPAPPGSAPPFQDTHPDTSAFPRDMDFSTALVIRRAHRDECTAAIRNTPWFITDTEPVVQPSDPEEIIDSADLLHVLDARLQEFYTNGL